MFKIISLLVLHAHREILLVQTKFGPYNLFRSIQHQTEFRLVPYLSYMTPVLIGEFRWTSVPPSELIFSESIHVRYCTWFLTKYLVDWSSTFLNEYIWNFIKSNVQVWLLYVAYCQIYIYIFIIERNVYIKFHSISK